MKRDNYLFSQLQIILASPLNKSERDESAWQNKTTHTHLYLIKSPDFVKTWIYLGYQIASISSQQQGLSGKQIHELFLSQKQQSPQLIFFMISAASLHQLINSIKSSDWRKIDSRDLIHKKLMKQKIAKNEGPRRILCLLIKKSGQQILGVQQEKRSLNMIYYQQIYSYDCSIEMKGVQSQQNIKQYLFGKSLRKSKSIIMIVGPIPLPF